MSGPPPRLAVLASGHGTNLQAILDACADARLAAEVVLVVSNDPAARALVRAAEAGVATVVAPHQGRDRAGYDHELAYTVSSHGVDLVVLAGWDRILSSHFLAHHTTINLHPAQPGAFPGQRAIARAYEAWQDGLVTEGGVMVHYVPDEGVDDGPVIAWEPVPFVEGDTLDRFEARVHEVEHRLLVESVARVLQRAELSGGRR